MNLKNNKGVTLLILCIMIVVIIIISDITITEGLGLLNIKNVNKMVSDIEIISTGISNYYLKNNELPLLGKYCDNKDFLIDLFNGEEYINQSDSGEYYVIDLSKLDNLTLNYGRDYEKWTSNADNEKYKDLYIINEVTHQVYYVDGITLKGEKYYTKLEN